MKFTYIINHFYILLFFLSIVYVGITFSQTQENFISITDFKIYKKCKKAINKRRNRYRRIINKHLKKTTKKMSPVIKKQIDKLSLISL